MQVLTNYFMGVQLTIYTVCSLAILLHYTSSCNVEFHTGNILFCHVSIWSMLKKCGQCCANLLGFDIS